MRGMGNPIANSLQGGFMKLNSRSISEVDALYQGSSVCCNCRYMYTSSGHHAERQGRKFSCQMQNRCNAVDDSIMEYRLVHNQSRRKVVIATSFQLLCRLISYQYPSDSVAGVGKFVILPFENPSLSMLGDLSILFSLPNRPPYRNAHPSPSYNLSCYVV
ncbi:uncharacterized protein BO80DRAFT_248800 [Aspergillus ibericus CBS 121593]|uniref:Uncharacterized protein n=1 Tax=Aspergillus ibericus CBS 121593 TaxID=1448316 RepID=A0A395GLT7_9EURO|nr:hypothetical protein BO80DRAFT_248800 [Aspergillus ibericus CBS 121593]RAK95787.1 hypothetical protein BO80DRAFT_248800 [Aspergillus ibericus CBS 121593]